MKKICKQCKIEFEGRRNQDYCCIKCKSIFNNDKAAMIRLKLSDNRILQKNFSILTQVYAQFKNQPVPLSTLTSKGFDTAAPTRRIKTLSRGYEIRISNGIGYRLFDESGKQYACVYMENDLKYN